MLPVGKILCRHYRVIKVTAQDSLGAEATYEALDERLSRLVVIEEVHLTDERRTGHFVREARASAGLRHPVIPAVFDFFTEGDSQFVVSEYIKGSNLAELLAQRSCPFSLEQVLSWGDTLLEALEYIHGHNIIHRHIKPENLKLSDEGQLYFLGFDLAERLGTEKTLDNARSVEALFSYQPGYAPLEQVRGTHTDIRSDLYSLGATLYTLLTGIVPPPAIEREAALMNGEPDPFQPVNDINTEIPQPIAAIINTATALYRTQRFANATEMLEALRSAKAAQPSKTVPRDPQIDTLRAFVPGSVSATDSFGEIPRAQPELTTGTILQGRYQVIEKLNEGGMGRVYLIKHQRLGNKLVLKENIFADPSKKLQELFEQEGTLLANLYHPQLPRVQDFFVEDGRSFFVMDFVEGDSLQQSLNQRQDAFAEAKVVNIAINVCKALEYLHGQSPPIVHCDIKPNNIVITPQGLVKLLDLGIARLFTETSSDNAPIAYTPGFASPEQWGGKINPRTDIFSLGATMYYLLTRRMVREDNQDLSFLNALPLRSINPQVSRALDDIVNKCLRRNEDDRWQTAGELRAALEALWGGRGEAPTPPQSKYDVFISYRRQKGSSDARAIRAELQRQHGMRVFLDVEDLDAGHFDEALLNCIAETPTFMIVLSPDCLDRCANEGDWLRQEITRAIKTNRKIIPVMLPGFNFPDPQTLPVELRVLSSHNSVSYSHEFFDAMIAKIARFIRQG